MKMTVCFLLLLLLCSPSTAQLQSLTDNDITATGEQTEHQRRETTNALNQEQVCLQDIHAVLRELSASLAEQRVEMRHLQRENEAQEAKLESQRAEAELQKQKLEAQEAKLESQRAEVELQKQKLEAQEAKLESQRAEAEKLKQELEAQAAELVTMTSRSNVTENQVEALRRDGEVKRVAFSASLVATGPVTLGPFNTQTPLVFRHVVSNIGNAYSPDTGLFTAPVRGAYHFEFHIGAHGHANHASAAGLIKNGGHVFATYELRTIGFGTSANGVTLLLEVGDVVFLRQWSNTRIFDDEQHYSTFSGQLLFTM